MLKSPAKGTAATSLTNCYVDIRTTKMSSLCLPSAELPLGGGKIGSLATFGWADRWKIAQRAGLRHQPGQMTTVRGRSKRGSPGNQNDGERIASGQGAVGVGGVALSVTRRSVLRFAGARRIAGEVIPARERHRRSWMAPRVAEPAELVAGLADGPLHERGFLAG